MSPGEATEGMTDAARHAILTWLDLSIAERAEMMDPDHGEEWPIPIAESIRAFDALSDSDWAVVSSYLRGLT